VRSLGYESLTLGSKAVVPPRGSGRALKTLESKDKQRSKLPPFDSPELEANWQTANDQCVHGVPGRLTRLDNLLPIYLSGVCTGACSFQFRLRLAVGCVV